MSLLSKKNESDSIEERANLDSAIKTVAGKITSLETKVRKSKIDVGNVCFEKIKHEINKLDMDRSMLSAVQAEFQADSVLAWAVLNGEADIILSADSDLAASLGGRCLSIKNFKFNDRSKVKTLQNMEIFSAEYSTVHDICGLLGVPTNSIVIAKRPVFEGICSMKLRCLIAVGIGCDVFLNGVPGITPMVIHEQIMKLKQQQKPESEYYDLIVDNYIKHYVLDVKKKIHQQLR
jgi:hypothetical protein